jgi:hypothetical protein
VDQAPLIYMAANRGDTITSAVRKEGQMEATFPQDPFRLLRTVINYICNGKIIFYNKDV